MDQIAIEVRNDGQDHIRISARGKTLLGRLLHSEAMMTFRHPRYGNFASMEAYWAFIRCNEAHPEFRQLSGPRARKATIQGDRVTRRDFRTAICEGLDCLVQQNPQLQMLLAANKLPFVRYEVEDGEALIEEQQAWFLAHLKKLAKGLACKPKAKAA